MNRRTKYPVELGRRAIRMVYEQSENHESQWAAIESVAHKIGCNDKKPILTDGLR